MNQAWIPEQVVTRELASQLLESQFPSLAGASITPLGEGFDNTIYEVNQEYVFRFPRRQVAVELLVHETQLLPWLSLQMPIAVPNPTYIGQPSVLYPWPFAGYRKLPGHPPGEISYECRMNSAVPLADFLRVLHNLPVQQAKERGVPYDTIRRLDVAHRCPRLQERVEEIKGLGISCNYRALEQFIESLDDADTPGVGTTLVHGDIHIRNMLVDGASNVSGIIDWGDVHIGHPAVDLSIIYSYLPALGRHIFYTSYGRVDESTKRLARMKSLYTTVMLILYGIDMKDDALVASARTSLHLALEDDQLV